MFKDKILNKALDATATRIAAINQRREEIKEKLTRPGEKKLSKIILTLRPPATPQSRKLTYADDGEKKEVRGGGGFQLTFSGEIVSCEVKSDIFTTEEQSREFTNFMAKFGENENELRVLTKEADSGEVIKFYHQYQPYYEFTNFAPNLPINDFPSVAGYENLAGREKVEEFRKLKSASEAFELKKRCGQTVKVEQKVRQNPTLAKTLLTTNYRIIIEDTQSDTKWLDGTDKPEKLRDDCWGNAPLHRRNKQEAELATFDRDSLTLLGHPYLETRKADEEIKQLEAEIQAKVVAELKEKLSKTKIMSKRVEKYENLIKSLRDGSKTTEGGKILELISENTSLSSSEYKLSGELVEIHEEFNGAAEDFSIGEEAKLKAIFAARKSEEKSKKTPTSEGSGVRTETGDIANYLEPLEEIITNWKNQVATIIAEANLTNEEGEPTKAQEEFELILQEFLLSKVKLLKEIDLENPSLVMASLGEIIRTNFSVEPESKTYPYSYIITKKLFEAKLKGIEQVLSLPKSSHGKANNLRKNTKIATEPAKELLARYSLKLVNPESELTQRILSKVLVRRLLEGTEGILNEPQQTVESWEQKLLNSQRVALTKLEELEKKEINLGGRNLDFVAITQRKCPSQMRGRSNEESKFFPGKSAPTLTNCRLSLPSQQLSSQMKENRDKVLLEKINYQEFIFQPALVEQKGEEETLVRPAIILEGKENSEKVAAEELRLLDLLRAKETELDSATPLLTSEIIRERQETGEKIKLSQQVRPLAKELNEYSLGYKVIVSGKLVVAREEEGRFKKIISPAMREKLNSFLPEDKKVGLDLGEISNKERNNAIVNEALEFLQEIINSEEAKTARVSVVYQEGSEYEAEEFASISVGELELAKIRIDGGGTKKSEEGTVILEEPSSLVIGGDLFDETDHTSDEKAEEKTLAELLTEEKNLANYGIPELDNLFQAWKVYIQPQFSSSEEAKEAEKISAEIKDWLEIFIERLITITQPDNLKSESMKRASQLIEEFLYPVSHTEKYKYQDQLIEIVGELYIDNNKTNIFHSFMMNRMDFPHNRTNKLKFNLANCYQQIIATARDEDLAKFLKARKKIVLAEEPPQKKIRTEDKSKVGSELGVKKTPTGDFLSFILLRAIRIRKNILNKKSVENEEKLLLEVLGLESNQPKKISYLLFEPEALVKLGGDNLLAQEEITKKDRPVEEVEDEETDNHYTDSEREEESEPDDALPKLND
ncbi:2324_t:CDS:10 [Ambispora gerdemannii]|uniref:2324_t:CDS:1 n=1 Tax=Ambispora gerdemannii TaxID=144530 RepID=A0A9N9BNB5_9GLOM|nr:2324_t:CDS:10 [Ambispora gerdemannii]